MLILQKHQNQKKKTEHWQIQNVYNGAIKPRNYNTNYNPSYILRSAITQGTVTRPRTLKTAPITVLDNAKVRQITIGEKLAKTRYGQTRVCSSLLKELVFGRWTRVMLSKRARSYSGIRIDSVLIGCNLILCSASVLFQKILSYANVYFRIGETKPRK